MAVAKEGTQEGQRCWPWWWPGEEELLAVVAAGVAAGGAGGGSHGGGGRGGRGGHGCGGSRTDPAVPDAISPLPRGLVPVHWVGSACAESEGHWG